MTRFTKTTFVVGFCLALLASATGCQTVRVPGSGLAGWMASSQDRKIEAHAEKSSFPSPSDVGLSSDIE